MHKVCYLSKYNQYKQCSHYQNIPALLGFNTSVFNAVLPDTTGRIERVPTAQGRAEALAKTAKTSSSGAIWLNTSGDVLNSYEVLEARKIQRSKWKQAADEKEERKLNAQEELLENATEVYYKFLTHGEKKLTVAKLKTLVKFIVHLEGRDDKKNVSQYNNREKLIKRLQQCDQPWPTYFKSSEDSNDNESSSDEDFDDGESSDSEEASVTNDKHAGDDASEVGESNDEGSVYTE
jgi:hypothetical protein